MRGGSFVLQVLGGLAAGEDEHRATPVRFSTRKVGALLAAVALSPGQCMARERLATLLWGNSSDQQARHSLRQALLFLKKDVHPFDILRVDAKTVALQPGTVRVDALEAERLAASDDFADLQRAAGFLRGPFLDGVAIHEEAFEEWAGDQRRRFDALQARVLERLSESASALGKGAEAIAAAERLLAGDPLREDWQRLALTLYARHRGRHEALAMADSFALLLRRELGVEPEPETLRLVADIRHGAITGAAAPAPASLSVPVASAPPAQARRPVLLGAQMKHVPLAGAALAIVLAVAGAIIAAMARPPEPGTTAVAKYQLQGAGQGEFARRSVRPGRKEAAASTDFGNGVVPVAVLPFNAQAAEGQDGDGRQPSALAELLTDELTVTLSSSSEIRVISRESARILHSESVDATRFGAEFGVHYVVEGSVSERGNGLRVNVGLVDARNGVRMWSRRFERDASERYAILDEIVSGLTRELQVEVSRIAGESGSRAVEAHVSILRGWSRIYASGREGRAALDQAKVDFEQALERDPANVRAQLGLAAYHVNIAVQLFAADPAVHLDAAEALLTALLERQARVAAAHTYMGLAHFARNRIPEAKRAFERAIELSPSHAPSHAQLGRIFLRLGQPQEALDRVRYAIRLSPRDPLLAYWLGFAGAAELELGRTAEAATTLKGALALNPRQPRNVLCLVSALALLGNMEHARDRFAQLQRELPHLSPETLIARFGGGRRASELHRGLRLALGQTAQTAQQ